MLAVAHRLVGLGINIEQTLHATTTDDVLFYDFGSILGLHLGVEGVVGDNLHNGAFLAETETTRGDDINLVGNAILLDSGFQVINDFVAVGCLTTGTTAAQHLQVLGSSCKTTTLL